MKSKLFARFSVMLMGPILVMGAEVVGDQGGLVAVSFTSLMLLFPKRIMRMARLDPNLVWEASMYFSSMWLLVGVGLIDLILQKFELFLAGMLVGVPICLATDAWMFKRIKNQALFQRKSRWGTWVGVAGAVVVAVALSLLSDRLGWDAVVVARQIFALTYGTMVGITLVSLVDTWRYERKYGPLYLVPPGKEV